MDVDEEVEEEVEVNEEVEEEEEEHHLLALHGASMVDVDVLGRIVREQPLRRSLEGADLCRWLLINLG